MARAFRQFSVFADDEQQHPIVRVRVTARANAAAAPGAGMQRTSSTGSPRISPSFRSSPSRSPTAVGFCGDSDPLGFHSGSPRYAGSPLRLEKMLSTGTLPSSLPGSQDMEQDVAAALKHLQEAAQAAKQPAAAAAATATGPMAGSKAAGAINRKASSKKRSSFRQAAAARLAAAPQP